MALANYGSKKKKEGKISSGTAGLLSYAPMAAMMASRGPWQARALGAGVTLAAGYAHGKLSPESFAAGTPARGVGGPKGAPRIVQAHGGESIVPAAVGKSMQGVGAAMDRVASLLTQILTQGRTTGKGDKDVNVYIGGEQVARAAMPAISRLMGITT